MRRRLWARLSLSLTVAAVAVGMIYLLSHYGEHLPTLLAIIAMLILSAVLFSSLHSVKYVLFLISSPRQNTETNRQQLDAYRGPFAFYLRNYSLERGYQFAFSKRIESLDWGHSPLFPDVFNHLENSVLRDLAIPAFTLVNRGDMAVGAALRIEVDQVDWQSTVEAVADRAALIIVYVHGLTTGIKQELAYLERAGAGHRTVIVAWSALLAEIERLYPTLHRSSHSSTPKGSGRDAIASLPRTSTAKWGKRAWEDWLVPEKATPGAPGWVGRHPGLVVGPQGEQFFRASDCRRVSGTRLPAFRNPEDNARWFLEDEIYWYTVLLLEAIGVPTEAEPSFDDDDLLFTARKAAGQASISVEPTAKWADTKGDLVAVEVQLDLEAWLRTLMGTKQFSGLSRELASVSAAVFSDAFVDSRWRDL